jgi:lysophospholipase L1-like esterase
LLKGRVGNPVVVDNRAVEGQTSDQLRNDVSRDASLRQALAKADVILIGIGGADLNAGDDALSAGQCKGRACYVKILQRFDANIAAITSEVRRVAPAAVLRGMSLPNALPGAGKAIPSFITADISRHEAIAERASVCKAMRSNGGRCIDVLRAFNGVNADANAYATGLMTKNPCCYPSARGQQLIARLLIATGLPTQR